MAEKNKRGFHTVEEPDMEEYEHKLREHRIKVVRRTVILIITVLAVSAGLWVFMALRHYENFDVTSSVDRADTEATKFADFGGNILKYSNDGAFYTDTANELIWNQTYEMADPQIDICEDYLTIYDRKGTMIYIMTKEGILGGIETTMPIQQVCVANQGTVAVLMNQQQTGYLKLYDKKGEELASGEIHGEKGGYPIALALSNDANKMAVSMLDINDGDIKTTIAFYNFGSVGQNEIDNCVGSYSYPDMVFPEIDFLSNDKMVAFGDGEVILFEGTQKPQVTNEIFLEKEVKSIFYNEFYFGIVTSNGDEAVTHHITVYNMNGKAVMEKDFAMEYEHIEFLENNEICVRNATSFDIYTIRGIYKCHYDFDQNLFRVLSGGTGRNYVFVLDGKTEKVQLK